MRKKRPRGADSECLQRIRTRSDPKAHAHPLNNKQLSEAGSFGGAGCTEHVHFIFGGNYV